MRTAKPIFWRALGVRLLNGKKRAHLWGRVRSAADKSQQTSSLRKQFPDQFTRGSLSATRRFSLAHIAAWVRLAAPILRRIDFT